MALILFGLLRAFFVESYRVTSPIMEPTLVTDDRVIVEKISYLFTSPRRGDVIAFQPPVNARNLRPDLEGAFIGRTIGIPGDRVEVRDGKVFHNGKPLGEPYLDERPTYTMAPLVVPAGQYLVLGDNRNNSFDSVTWGYLPHDSIIGRVVWRFFPLERLGPVSDEPPQAAGSLRAAKPSALLPGTTLVSP
jgi:signal peptidase I